MDVIINPARIIFSPINAILPMIQGKKELIFASFNIAIEKKVGRTKKKKSGYLNFVFSRERRYTKILWSFSDARVDSYRDIQKWTMSANNDGPIELIDGIESPFFKVAHTMMESLEKKPQSENYTMTVSWVLENPKILAYTDFVRLNQTPPYIFRID